MSGDESDNEQSIEWINCPHCSSNLFVSPYWGAFGAKLLLGTQEGSELWDEIDMDGLFCIKCYFIRNKEVHPEVRGGFSIRSSVYRPKEMVLTAALAGDDGIKFTGKLKRIELGSIEWKIYLRALGIEPDKLGTNLNLVDEGVQKSSELSSLSWALMENGEISSKIKDMSEQIKNSLESFIMLKDQLEVSKNVNYSIMSKSPIEQRFTGWDTVFGKARRVADSKPLNVNKREMALLRFVKNKGRYEGKDWMELNRSWRGEMKEVTQARISQIISSLIEKEYLETVQTKGSGSSRVVKIPNNLNIDSLVDLSSNNQRINANSHWSKNDDEKLLSLHKDRNLSIAEIAYEMGRSEASIRSRLATNLHKHSFDAK